MYTTDEFGSTSQYVYSMLKYMYQKGEETHKMNNMEELQEKLNEWIEHAEDVYKNDKEQCQFFRKMYNQAKALSEKHTFESLKELAYANAESETYSK